MKAWIVRSLGEPEDAMELCSVRDPTPGEGEVLIEVEAVALNHPDLLLCRGEYQQKPTLPFTPGREIAGRVLTTVQGSGLVAGQRVVAIPPLPGGGLAERVAVPAHEVMGVPEELDVSLAATLPLTYPTAHMALHHRARIQEAENLLVLGGSGGIGMAAVQVGRAAGARVIATAGSQEKVEFCRAMGADLVLDYRAPGFVDTVLAATDGRGADVVVDPVGGAMFHLARRCTAFEGRLVCVGFASGEVPEVTLGHVLVKNYAILGLHLALYRSTRRELLRSVHSQLVQLLTDGIVTPSVRKLPLEQAVDGLKLMRDGAAMGKVVVVLGAN